jgi:hypothetical protein
MMMSPVVAIRSRKTEEDWWLYTLWHVSFSEAFWVENITGRLAFLYMSERLCTGIVAWA